MLIGLIVGYLSGVVPMMYAAVGLSLILVVLAIAIKPIRKTMGLLSVILGIPACLSVVGVVAGVPMIVVGGLMMFV